MSFIDSPRRSTARRWLFQIHLWLGLILGPVIGVVGLTGAIVVFRYELNRMTTPGTAYVQPQDRRLTIDELTARVQAASPGDRITQAGWGEAGPDNAWNFRSTSPDGHRIHTFINQYTGEITGRDDYQNKWMQWFFDLHAYLLAGDTGEFLNGFVGFSTVILSVTGMVVWWPGAAHWLFGFRYLWGAGWKRQNYDMHKVVGFYSSLALAFVAFTGAYYAFPSMFRNVTERVTGTKVTVGAPTAVTAWADRHVTLEHFLRAAEEAQPGAAAISLSFPQKAGEPVTVRTKEPRDWHRIGLNYVYLEPADARIVRSDRFSDVTAGTQAILLMYPLHFGRFGGRWGSPTLYYGVMVLYVIVGVTPFVLMVTGLLMYWNRSFSKKWKRARLKAYSPSATLAGESVRQYTYLSFSILARCRHRGDTRARNRGRRVRRAGRPPRALAAMPTALRGLTRDTWLLFATRFVRLFAYGSLSVVLVFYLVGIGLSQPQTGMLLTLTLVGDTLVSLYLTTQADRIGRRRMLVAGALLMAAAGLVFASTQTFWLLVLAGTIGVISPSGNEVGPFLPIEQAALSQVVTDQTRTEVFAWYTLAGSLATALGALAAGTASRALQQTVMTPGNSYRTVVILYAALGVLLAVLFSRLSRTAEAYTFGETRPFRATLAGLSGLDRSRGVVMKLSILFALDSFGGGFVIQSFAAYWFYLRFGVNPGTLGMIFFWANIFAGISALLASRLASRFGLINTMVATHLPSNILLILVPLMPTLPLAVLVLLLRFSVSQMDVPARQSYIMAVVTPAERSAAAGITGVARTIGAAISPFFVGLMFARPSLISFPFFIAGALKILYDVMLYRQFAAVQPAADVRD